MTSRHSRRVGGWLLAVGGIGFFLAGALHPQGHDADFHTAMIGMLANSRWAAAHWIALATGFILASALWLLADDAWPDGGLSSRIGVRLALVATLFMTVEWAVEIAARSELPDYVGGHPAPLLALVDAMQGAGWPAFGVGFALLALGSRATPRWVGIIGALGAIALGAAGLVAQALHVAAAGALFAGGHLLAFWMIWAGARAETPVASRRSARTQRLD